MKSVRYRKVTHPCNKLVHFVKNNQYDLATGRITPYTFSLPKDMIFNLSLELGHVLNKLTQIITILLINFTDFRYCIYNFIHA
jgi:hypothetical protein